MPPSYPALHARALSVIVTIFWFDYCLLIDWIIHITQGNKKTGYAAQVQVIQNSAIAEPSPPKSLLQSQENSS
jgi:hypothetical protein